MTFTVAIDFEMLGKLLWPCAICLLFYTAFRLRAYQWNRHSALRDMPGPAAVSWFWGSSPEIPHFEARGLQHAWIWEYGRTFKIRGPLMRTMLYAGDPKAVAHVLTHATFERTPSLRAALRLVIDQGMLSTEGLQHRQQRRVLNPAFGLTELRKQTEVFVAKSNILCSIWKEMCSQSERDNSFVTLNAFTWMNKVTLDIITLAGFGYDADSLHTPDDQPNEAVAAIKSLFEFDMKDPFFFLQLLVPIFRLVPTRRLRQQRESRETLRRICMRLVANRKASILKEQTAVDGSSAIRKHDIEGSDLLSLLVRANLATDLPDSLRLSDEDVLSQAPTFIVAGHETTSTAVSWALFALSCDLRVRTKLRNELWSVPTDTPSMDELNSLPYLDHVVREALRLYTPASSTERVAVQDDIIPLSTPYTDNKGILHHEIAVSKGDVVFIPIYALHTSTDIWGQDAHQFHPERWEAIPDTVKQIPSIWGNVAAFLAGHHACIGYRFAVVEMKALLFAIIRSFEVNLAASPAEIIRKTAFVGRPMLVTNPSAGYQLPLIIRRAMQE